MSWRQIADAIGLREGEGPRTLRLFGFVLLLTISFVFAKTAQQGLFLGAYSRSRIPDAFILSALTLAAASFVASALAARWGPTRLLLVLLAMGAGLFATARLLLTWDIASGPLLIYILVEAVIGLFLVQAWTVVTEALDIRSAKRLLPLIGNAAGLGWMLGGFAARPLSSVLGAADFLLVTSILLVACLFVVRLIAAIDLGGSPATGKRGTSLLEGARAGIQFVLEVPLLRALAIVAVSCLLVEQILDYQLYAATQAHFDHDADAIAGFMGMFYGATGIITLVLTVGLSGRVLTRLGSAPSTLTAPALALIGALAFLLFPGLAVIVATRGGYRVLKQSLSSPARAQMQTSISAVRRAQSGALVKGVLAPAFYALGGGMLKLVPESLGIRWLAIPALAVSLLAVVVTWLAVRPAYFGALRSSVEQQQLDLDADSELAIDREQIRLLAEQTGDADPERASFAVSLLATRAPTQARPVLTRACSHPSPQVRAAAVAGLGRIGNPADAAIVTSTLEQADDDVVERAGLRALVALGARDGDAVRARCSCEDARVRALAFACLVPGNGSHDAAATAQLRDMLTSKRSAERAAAAWAMGETKLRHPTLRECFAELVGDPATDVRVQAITAAGRLGDRELIEPVVLALAHPATMDAAFKALAAAGDDLVPEVERALRGAPLVVHSRTAAALAASSGPNGDRLLARLLVDDRAAVRYRAARALSARRRSQRWWPPPKQRVREAIESELRIGYGYYALLAGIARTDGVEDWDIEPEFEFVAAEIRLRIRQTEKRLFSLLALLIDPKLVASVEAHIHDRDLRKAAASLELLEHALGRDLRRSVLLFLDERSLRLRMRDLGDELPIRGEYLRDPLSGILQLDDEHLQRCAMLCYRDKMAVEHPEDQSRLEPMLPLVKKLQFLRRIPLFQELSGEDLMQVAKIAGDLELRAGQEILHKGDPGDELYLIVRGSVTVRDGETEIATIGENEVVGELAVLDNEPRSACIVCNEDTFMLRISQPDLEELMERRPRIAREIIRVLTRRLRLSTQRISNS